MAETSEPALGPAGGCANRTTVAAYCLAGTTAYAAPISRHTRKVARANTQWARTVRTTCLRFIPAHLLPTPRRSLCATAPHLRHGSRVRRDPAREPDRDRTTCAPAPCSLGGGPGQGRSCPSRCAGHGSPG